MNRQLSQQRSSSRGRLTSRILAENFGAGTDIARIGVRAFYDAARRGNPSELSRWSTLFGEALGHDPQQQSDAIEKLASVYGIDRPTLTPSPLLFAIHTYFALLAKLTAWDAIALHFHVASPVDELHNTKTDSQRREVLEAHEQGPMFRDDLFGWYIDTWSESVGQWTGDLARILARYEPAAPWAATTDDADLLKRLYQGLFPRSVRHKLGEFYTPDWLAEHVLDQAGYTGEPDCRLLDPTCGSGTFLMTAIRRARAWYADSSDSAGLDGDEFCRKILANIVGLDLNPVAVTAARANYLIAMADLLPRDDAFEIPVYLCDSILDGTSAEAAQAPFDMVVGNPPWIAWDHLPADYREATRPLWEEYGLFTLSGNAARHGGGKKDLSMLVVARAADRYLRQGGRLAMVLTQTLFQTKGAGDGFRRFRLGPTGEPLRVIRVDDMVAIKPFEDAANWTSTILLEKGSPTEYPVPYYRWLPADSPSDGFTQQELQAEPIDPSRPGSPWFLRPGGFDRKLEDLIGPSDYTAHLGANSGGANGVYWMEILEKSRNEDSDGTVRIRNIAARGKRRVESVEEFVEAELLYPLIRWSDVARFRAVPSAHLLLTQDVHSRSGIDIEVMQRDYPRALDYLCRFERVLCDRAALKRYQSRQAFYSMYNVATYTVAPIKVVWRRMDRRVNAAVVSEIDDPTLGRRSVIPQETCVLIACDSTDEAHYLCAVLNSSIVNFLVTSHSVCGGKGFGTPSMLDYLRIGQFDATEPGHMELTQLSRQAHESAAVGDVPREIQQRIDRCAAALWGLSESEQHRMGSERH